MSYKVPKWIAVDFDGTLCEFSYPGIGKIKPGAKEAVARFRELGYKVVIYSCRTCYYYPEIFGLPGGKYSPPGLAMKAWLEDEGIVYDELYDGTKGKPMCDFYIDDKGVRYDNNWGEVVKFVEERT